MEGNALEVALALIRHPANRVPLRVRPLPEGIGELIELAAGVPARIAEASSASGEPPHHVREAARFYIREVLLFPDADAYRVLGVPETASATQIRLHYRRLQHWLHPDRRGNDWESAFAIRINQAWGELRTQGRRAAYDARRRRQVGTKEDSIAQSFVVDGRVPESGLSAANYRWVLPVAAVAVCLGLVLLVVIRQEPPPPTWETQAEQEIHAARQPRADVERAVLGNMRESRPEDFDEVRADGSLHPRPVLPRQARNEVIGSRQEGDESSPRSLERAPLPGKTPLESRETKDISAPNSPADWLEHEGLARDRGRQLLKYLGSGSKSAPAIWNSLDTAHAAATLRQRFDEGGPQTFRKVRFSDPEWRITGHRAHMTSTFRRRLGQSGALRVDLVWRDGAWLVDRIEADRF